MTKRCGECASKNIKETNLKGKRFPWKDYPSVLLSQDFKAQTCQDCGELILRGSDSANFDKAIKTSIHDQVIVFIETILGREKNVSQANLATRLGLTPEYLSEIKSGRKQPGFGVFNFLKTLALDARAFKEAEPEFLSETMIRKISA